MRMNHTHFIFFGILLVIVICGYATASELNIPMHTAGYVTRTSDNSTFLSLVTGSGSAADQGAGTLYSYIFVNTGTTSGLFYQIPDVILIPDTTLPDTTNDIIDSVTLNITPSLKTTDLGAFSLTITGGAVGNFDTLASSDYQKRGSVIFSNNISSSSISISKNVSFIFNNAGMAAINKTGCSVFRIQYTDEVNQTFSGAWALNKANNVNWYGKTSGSYHPSLIIKYHKAAASSSQALPSSNHNTSYIIIIIGGLIGGTFIILGTRRKQI